VSVCRYFSTNLCCEILFGDKNIVINCIFMLFFFFFFLFFSFFFLLQFFSCYQCRVNLRLSVNDQWVSLISVSLNAVFIQDWFSYSPLTHLFLYPSHNIYWCFVQTKSYGKLLCPNKIFMFESNSFLSRPMVHVFGCTFVHCKLLQIASNCWNSQAVSGSVNWYYRGQWFWL
jgi:hypothetical protein